MDFLIHYAPWVLLGTVYGFVFGIIPVAGAGTALLTVYSFIAYFKGDPYSLIVFTTAIVVAASVGDLFASVVMNIPGGGGSAATMVDGYPMARRGEAARAMSASVFSAVSQGLLWGTLTILFLPYYAQVVLSFGIPEQWSFLILAITSICFLSSQYWARGILGLMLGIFAGAIGTDPVTNAERFTGGWFYLADGIQFAPVMAGLMALPEIVSALWIKTVYLQSSKDNWHQIRQGFWDWWHNRWVSFRGGVIGGTVGMLPGIGGAIVDWLSYGQTVATNKNETVPFGEGNVKGVIGPEGATLAQKSTAYVPTVLFGIPAAPFEAVIMSLLAYVGLDLGSPTLLSNHLFFNTLSFGFMASLALTFLISIWFIRYATLITRIPFKYWAVPLIALIVWSCANYTGGWEDYAILAAMTLVGLCLKYFKISRISFIIGFVLSHKLELITGQFLTLYSFQDLVYRPISLCLLAVSVIILVYGLFFNRTTIKYY
jgi:hypothetical protein